MQGVCQFYYDVANLRKYCGLKPFCWVLAGAFSLRLVRRSA